MNINELREKSYKIATEARAHLDTVKEDRSNEAEVVAQFDRMMLESDGYAERAQRAEAAEARVNAAERIVTEIADTKIESRSGDNTEEKRAAAFVQYLRGEKNLAELRAMGVATDAKGGALVPTAFVNKLITHLRSEGPMLNPNLVTYLTTDTGNNIEMPSFDDNVRAVIIGENTQIPEDDLNFDHKTLGAFKYTSKMVRVSNELLQDAAIPADDIVAGALGRRISRGLNEDLTIGSGVGAPEGIMTAASALTTASSTGFTAEELIALYHSIDPLYRDKATWMFNDKFLLKVRSMRNPDGSWVWSTGITPDAPATILGRPYVSNPYVSDTVATGNKVALFGDLKAYTVRQVKAIYVRRLEERYADFDQVGFVSLARFDGKLLDTNAVKALKIA